jgi:hypothetical protein
MLERLLAPLGDQFLKRPQKAVLISSHLREPRASCYAVLKKAMPVDGMGPYFDKNIKDHHSSNFYKKDILNKYGFNLCPENGIYPGYVTEKVPEAFAAGCLPITYLDTLHADFNTRAFINLASIKLNDTADLEKFFFVESRSKKYAHEPLLFSRPKLHNLKLYVQSIIDAALI